MNEQFPAAGQFLTAVAVSKETKMPDARESVRQGVEEKAADELVGSQRHDARFVAAVAAIVLPLKGDGVVLMSEQALIGDGDAMGVAAEIGEHLLRPAKRRLGIDHPFGLTERGQVSGEPSGIAERLQFSVKLQFSAVIGLLERFEEQPSEQM